MLLSITSILTVYSSIVTLAYKHTDGNTFYYLIKHSSFLIIGLLLTYFTHNIKYTYFSKLSQLLLYLSIPLLLLTLVMGSTINDASRWLTIPILNYTFQTSDLAKFALIMYLARIISKKQDNIKDFKSAFIPIILPVLVVCGLILPANLSTAALLFITSIILMFIGRVNIKYILSLIGIGVAGLTVVILIGMAFPGTIKRVDTWVNRIEDFREGNVTENYQSEQSKIAIATGGVFGKGPGKSTQRNFLPHPYSDFIYAIVIEEYGLIGGILLLFLYLILLFRGIRISSTSDKPFGTLLVFGFSFSLVFQAMINMAVAVNLFPVTGQPLPMVSMGGTSILFTFIAMGVILSVSKQHEPQNSLADAAA